MRVISWNIAGGHTVNSQEAFDYAAESLDYFIEQLHALDPDVICLQEVHTSGTSNNAEAIAKALGNYKHLNAPFSPSHITEGKQLGTAILTRGSYTQPSTVQLPALPEDLSFANGKPAVQHQKGLQSIVYQNITVANTHLLPLVVFGRSYQEGSGAELGTAIDRVVSALATPLIFCGDFGMSSGQTQVFANAFQKLHIKNALPPQATHFRQAENGAAFNAPDAIYYSSDNLRVVDAGIVQTPTDHYLCWADIEKAEV